MEQRDLIDALRQALGAAAVIDDPQELALAAADVLPDADAVTPVLLLRPRDTAHTATAMRLLDRAGSAVVLGGAGLSYTGGVVPHAPAVVIDTTAMTDITVIADDLYAIAGAGCTWATLHDALKPHGLRPEAAPPISGSHSTVGGAASRSVCGSEGFIGLAVVLANGDILQTGGWSTPGGVPFWRHYGPDLTGLFIGDCGACTRPRGSVSPPSASNAASTSPPPSRSFNAARAGASSPSTAPAPTAPPPAWTSARPCV